MKKGILIILALMLMLVGCGKDKETESVQEIDTTNKTIVESKTEEAYDKPAVEAEEPEITIIDNYTAENEKYNWDVSTAEYSSNEDFRYVSGTIQSKDGNVFATYSFNVDYSTLLAPLEVVIQTSNEENVLMGEYTYPYASNTGLNEYVVEVDNVDTTIRIELEEVLTQILTKVFY